MPAASFRDAIEMVVGNWFKFHNPYDKLEALAAILELSEEDVEVIVDTIIAEPDIKTKAQKTMLALEKLNYFGDHDECLDDLERDELDRRRAQASADDADESAIDTQNQTVDDVDLLERLGRRIQAAYPTLQFEIDEACVSIKIWEPNAETEIHFQVHNGKVYEHFGFDNNPEAMGSTDLEVYQNMVKGCYFDLVNGPDEIDEGPKPNVCENCGGALDFNYCTFCQTRQQPETD